MSLSKRCFKIAEILAAFFTGSQTEQDKCEFEEWLRESEVNSALSDKLLKKETFEKNRKDLERFPAEKAWQDVDKRLNEVRKRVMIWRRTISYAAAISIFLIMGIYYWWRVERSQEKIPVLTHQIVAGTTGARLTLGDGRIVDIVKDQKLELQEIDGTKIVTDSVGIDYSAQETVYESEILNKVQTLVGMEYSLTLSDGTKVYLNAESQLEFPTHFNGNSRVVKLKGEAFFEVSKDATRPFIVKVDSLQVRVLGTSFNLRSYDDDKQVVTTLVEGKVEVVVNKNAYLISPGMQAIYKKKAGEINVRDVDVLQYIAWQSGKFIFRNECLENVMAYLSKWYGFTYRFIDEHAKEVQIGARLDRYDSMEPIVEMLKRTKLVNITQIDNMFYISSAK